MDDEDVEWAPPLLSLVGMTPMNEEIHQSCLGCFELREQRVNGRVSYVQCGQGAAQGKPRALLWYCNHFWYVGPFRSLGKAAGIVAAPSTAMRPDLVAPASCWCVWRESKWVNAKELRCFTGLLV